MTNQGRKLESDYNNDVDAFLAAEIKDTPPGIIKPGKEKMVLYHQKIVFGKNVADLKRKVTKLINNPAI
jgi:hypothetical protein